MARAGDELVDPATGERIVFRRTAADTGGAALELDDVWVRADHATPDHAHPGMQERWEVRSGRVRFRVGDAEWTARPGQVVVAPPGVAHRAWNVGGEPVHLRIRMTPALRWEDAIPRLFSAHRPEELGAVLRDFPRELEAVRPDSALDAWMPGWHFRSRHARSIAGCDAAVAMRALAEVQPRDLPLTGLLMGIRSLPGALARRGGAGRAPASSASDRPLLERMTERGFVPLAQNEDEVVLGAVGRFWRLREGLVPLAGAAEFAGFDRPGFARAAMGVRAAADGGNARLVTETRVVMTDLAARRSFGRYWGIVRFGSGAIRLELLTATARRAGRTAADARLRAGASTPPHR